MGSAAERARQVGRRWIAAVVLASIALCGVIFGAHVVQTRHLAENAALLVEIKQTAIDLEQGFLHLHLAGGPASPWQAAQGLALLTQAEQALHRIGESTGQRERIEKILDSINAFRAGLTPMPGVSTDPLQARMEMHELHRRLAALDAAVSDHTRLVGRRMELLANGTVALAALLMFGVCAGMIRSERVRQRAQSELERGGARLRSTLSSLSEGVLAFDAEMRLIDWNPAAERLLGFRPEQIRLYSPGMHKWRLLNADGSPMAAEQSPPALALRTGEPQHNQVIAVQLRTGLRLMSTNAEPLRDGDGEHVTGVVLSFTDVTEERAMSAQLAAHRDGLEALVQVRTRELESALAARERAESFAQTITDHQPTLLSYVDRDRRLAFANRAYLDWFGFKREAAIGRPVTQLFTEAEYAPQMQLLWRALGGESIETEMALRRHDGVEGTFWTYRMPDRRQGRIEGAFLIATNVSELVEVRRALGLANEALAERAEQAEAATRAKSAFVANMSHEIRTPMNAILGLTHLLTRGTSDALALERLRKIDSAAKHLLQVINDILDLSKIEAGRHRLDEVSFDRDELLTRALELVSDAAAEKGLELVLDPGPLPATLHGDTKCLTQALVNLLSNAVKFTERGWVQLRCDVLAEDADRLEVRFEVRDSGIGIAPEARAMLFNAFEQADNSNTRRHGGTGLGLALTRHLALQMGGQIGVETETGAGSCFWFTARLGRDESSDASGLDMASWAGRRAWLVDDLQASRLALSAQLAELGLDVEAWPDGDAAVRHLGSLGDAEAEGSRPELLVIDWRMPAPDGVETWRRLGEALGDAMPPCLLLVTGDASKALAQMRSGGDSHAGAAVEPLGKPATPTALRHALGRLMRQAPAALPAQPLANADLVETLRRMHAGRRVLLAEDNPVNQEVACDLLTSAGLQVAVAGDGAQAVDLALQESFDLVLMDIQMPVMDGFAAARTLRSKVGTSMPIIAMTANAFVDDREACLRAGMNDHVGKPVEPQVLYGTLLRWLSTVVDGTARGDAGTPARDARPAGEARPAERTAAAPSTTIPAAWRGVAGVDTEQGLRNVGGLAAGYQRVLKRFADMYADGEPAFASLGESDAPTSSAELRAGCHSVRGVCATIGALELAERFRALEASLDDRPRAALAEAAHDLDQELRALATAIRRALDSDGQAPPPPVATVLRTDAESRRHDRLTAPGD